MEQSKKTVWFAGVLLAAAVVAGSVYLIKNNSAKPGARAVIPVVPVDRSVVQLPTGQISPEFPPNIPREQGATVLESSQAQYAAEKTTHGTYQFVSAADVVDNYIRYRTYFEQNHWKQLTTVEPNLTSAFLLYGLDRIQIAVSISKDASSSGSTVALSVVKR